MIKTTFFAGAVFAFAIGTMQPVQAADSCGWWAFSGAWSSRYSAQRRANRIGGIAWSIDSSNSPNAGKGLWAAAIGPGSKSQARRWVRRIKNRGYKAYRASRCLYGE